MCVNYAPDEATTGNDGDEFDDEDDLPLSHLLPADVTFDEYAAVDENVETCEQPTDDDIVAAVTAPAEPGSAAPSDEEEEEEGDTTSLDLPGRSQAMEALETLQRYLLGVSNSEHAKMSLLSVEQFLTSKGRCTTQMTLDSFSENSKKNRVMNWRLINWIWIDNKSMKCVLFWLQRTSHITYCFFRSLEIRYNEVLLYMLTCI